MRVLEVVAGLLLLLCITFFRGVDSVMSFRDFERALDLKSEEVQLVAQSEAAQAAKASRDLYKSGDPIPYAGIPAPRQSGLNLPVGNCITACTSKCVPKCIRQERDNILCASECNKFCLRDCETLKPSDGPKERSQKPTGSVKGATGPPGTGDNLKNEALVQKVERVAMSGAAAATASSEGGMRRPEPAVKTSSSSSSTSPSGIQSPAWYRGTYYTHGVPLEECASVCRGKCTPDCVKREGAPSLCARTCHFFCKHDCEFGFQTSGFQKHEGGSKDSDDPDRPLRHQRVEKVPEGQHEDGQGSDGFQYLNANDAIFPWESKKLDSRTLGPRECRNHCNFECLRECTEGYDQPHKCPEECSTNCERYCSYGKAGTQDGSGHPRGSQITQQSMHAYGNDRARTDQNLALSHHPDEWGDGRNKRKSNGSVKAGGHFNSGVNLISNPVYAWLAESIAVVLCCACVYVLVWIRSGVLRRGYTSVGRAASGLPGAPSSVDMSNRNAGPT